MLDIIVDVAGGTLALAIVPAIALTASRYGPRYVPALKRLDDRLARERAIADARHRHPSAR